MSFSKCSISVTEKVTHFRLYPHIGKRSNYVTDKQNFENEAFEVGFVLLKIKIIEKFELNKNLIINSIQDLQNLSASKRRLNFENR